MRAYRTTVKTSIGQTPFRFTYGAEQLVTIELSIPTARISGYDLVENKVARATTLVLLDELREEASIRNATYKESTARHHDKKERPKDIKVEGLVLRKFIPVQKRRKVLFQLGRVIRSR